MSIAVVISFLNAQYQVNLLRGCLHDSGMKRKSTRVYMENVSLGLKCLQRNLK